MRILHLSTKDVAGGAARAAYRLHSALRSVGYDSAMLVRERSSRDPNVFRFQPSRRFIARFRRRWRQWGIRRDRLPYPGIEPTNQLPFTDDRSSLGKELAVCAAPYDVVHLHWVAGDFLDYSAFLPTVTRMRPVVWTFHDMNPFTGGCHCSLSCTKYRTRCGACPQLESTDPRDLSSQIWRRKQSAFTQLSPSNLRIVSPSQWLARETAASSLLRDAEISVIPHGLDTRVFSPRSGLGVRQIYDIADDALVVLFCARHLGDPVKGFSLLLDVLENITRSGIRTHLLCVGAGSLDSATSQFPFPVSLAGLISDEHFLSLHFCAADLFVMPSSQEAFGLTVLEAMACGTPVVGFDVGGIPDMVTPGETGLLAPAGDIEGLAAAIRQLLEDAELRARLGMNCRKRVLEKFTLERQARAYIVLYESLLKDGR